MSKACILAQCYGHGNASACTISQGLGLSIERFSIHEKKSFNVWEKRHVNTYYLQGYTERLSDKQTDTRADIQADKDRHAIK